MTVDTTSRPPCEGSRQPTIGYYGNRICSVCCRSFPRSRVARKHSRDPDPEVAAKRLVNYMRGNR